MKKNRPIKSEATKEFTPAHRATVVAQHRAMTLARAAHLNCPSKELYIVWIAASKKHLDATGRVHPMSELANR